LIKCNARDRIAEDTREFYISVYRLKYSVKCHVGRYIRNAVDIKPDVVSISRKLCFRVVAGSSKNSFDLHRRDKNGGNNNVVRDPTFEKSQHSPFNFRLFSSFHVPLLPSVFPRDGTFVRFESSIGSSCNIGRCKSTYPRMRILRRVNRMYKKRFNLRWN